MYRTNNKSLVKCYNNHRKLYTSSYSSLEKYKADEVSNIVCLKEGIPNGVNNKKDLSYNEKVDECRKKQSKRSSLRNERGHKKNMKNKSCIFETKKYSHLEKKIFKELDYVDFLKNSRTISEKTYYKIIRKKYGLRLGLPFIIILLLSTSLIFDFGGFGIIGALIKILNTIATGWLTTLHNILKTSFLSSFLKSVDRIQKATSSKRASTVVPDYFYVTGFFGIFIYLIPFIVLGITIILSIVYYHRKVKKYQKIKFRKR
ncbi:Plasmodium exported protein (Pm-fam-a like), unknown function [Plasmodium malariae]|uniref:Fam-l protein n=1 Tax=Plasmodium malariae TaxID=5858 RepID=A0A1A8WTL5_PLAMA|nr:Plasmodium exported protein (Pm-fam-a like), unknown function [Plasmodium malariae]